MADIRFTPLTKQSWPDFEALFDEPGGPKYCWCMAWRDIPNRHSASNAERRQAMKSFVETDTPVGILAYLDGKPVAWCSVATRESLRRLAPWQDDAERNVWPSSASSSSGLMRPGHRLRAARRGGGTCFCRRRQRRRSLLRWSLIRPVTALWASTRCTSAVAFANRAWRVRAAM